MQVRHLFGCQNYPWEHGRSLRWPDSSEESGQYCVGTSGNGYGLPHWAAEGHSLADHRSVAPCGNYGERIRVVSTTVMRRNSFLFCVSSVNPASFHPIDSGTECPVLATGRPVSLGSPGWAMTGGGEAFGSGARRDRDDGTTRRRACHCDCHGLR